ncbi:MAG TPA: STM4012 family radical SAM protein [Polyangia bacterium]|jgi:oxygen-independent coproporphyrinogen-3 oxidase|nr:STM4012 family radical SAM protein [Polyangia bacterium]
MTSPLADPPYGAYLYSYPHKTAYRPLPQPRRLADVWARERREALFLYLHVPFCEMRCGFCNLFTTARPKADFVDSYLDTLERQARRARAALEEGAGGPFSFARFAVGGGTPTLLSEAALARLLDVAEVIMGADLARLPGSAETSPETATVEKLRLLVERGADRLSIGVQSFIEAETRAVNRPQDPAEAHAAIEAMRAAGPSTVNVDLIYGLPGQTAASWQFTLDETLRHEPEEVYLYPLYVRPLTTLGRRRANGQEFDDYRLALYRQACEHLGAAGYRQISMRMFRAARAPSVDGPVFCCQDDGMLGLGCGARSYTAELHYSTEFAVGAAGVREILASWVARDESSFDVADYGFVLDEDERRRRFVILSLLADEGLDRRRYADRFGDDPLVHLPALDALEPEGLASWQGPSLRLTARGFERADAIGPWLQSPRVRDLMNEWELR